MNPQQSAYIDVMYIPGITVHGMTRARLEWKLDNTITLTTAEGTPEQPIYKEIMNVPVSDIKKVKSVIDEIKIVTPKASYRMSVAQYSTPAIAGGGVAGTAVSYGMYKKSGADKWLQRFKDNGVAVSRLGFGAFIGIALAGAAVVIAIALGIFLLTHN